MAVGQVTLIPPENSGRIRKQKERKNLRQFDLRAVGVSGVTGVSSSSGTSGTISSENQRARDGGGDGSSRPASSLGTARAGFRSGGGGGRANEGRLSTQGRDGLSSPIRDSRRTREYNEGWDDLTFDRLSFILRF